MKRALPVHVARQHTPPARDVRASAAGSDAILGAAPHLCQPLGSQRRQHCSDRGAIRAALSAMRSKPGRSERMERG